MQFTKAKAIVAAIGATLTALMTALATAEVVMADDAVSFEEWGSVTLAVLTLMSTVYGVWKVPNRPIPPTTGGYAG